jgi:predicted O-methyltransferase YrrM
MGRNPPTRALAALRRAAGAPRVFAAARRAGRAVGLDVLRADFYSPVPDTAALPAHTWKLPSPMPGLVLDLDAQLAWLRDELGAALAEFTPPRDAPGDETGFHFANFAFGPVDASVLYAVVRTRRPRRVLEIGAGFSTLAIAGAARRNAAEGSPVHHRVVDPHPHPALAHVAGEIDLQVRSATDLPAEAFAELGAGDVLFVDTTHTLRPGGDVVRLLLEAVPSLAPGVLVHVHDVFRPYEYPRALYDEFGVAWQEQYLVQALLAFNAQLRVVCANHALFRERAADLRALVPGFEAVPELPSSFWFERVAVP